MSTSVERVRERLNYDPETGIVSWRSLHPMANKKFKVGDPAGYWTGYAPKRLTIEIDGKPIHAHRIAWALHYGEWPALLVDHKDGDPSNNRIANLRLATQLQNAKNRKVQSTSGTGIKGVERAGSNWRARITHDRRRIELGCFKTIEEARAAYNAAAIKYHGEFARAA